MAGSAPFCWWYEWQIRANPTRIESIDSSYIPEFSSKIDNFFQQNLGGFWVSNVFGKIQASYSLNAYSISPALLRSVHIVSPIKVQSSLTRVWIWVNLQWKHGKRQCFHVGVFGKRQDRPKRYGLLMTFLVMLSFVGLFVGRRPFIVFFLGGGFGYLGRLRGQPALCSHVKDNSQQKSDRR